MIETITANQIKLRMPLFVNMMFSSGTLVNVVLINKGFFIVLCLFPTVGNSSIILTVVTIDISPLFARLGGR